MFRFPKRAFVKAVKTAIAKVQNLPDYPAEKKGLGGWAVVSNVLTGRLVLVTKIGKIPTKKTKKYRILAPEKAQRLFRTSSQGFVSSFQSRNVKLDRWGGAVLIGELIFSFSGLTELADEAVMLAAAVKMQYMSKDVAMKIAQISNNKDYFRICA